MAADVDGVARKRPMAALVETGARALCGRAMVTTKELATLARALPGVEAKSHFGAPSFRRNGRMFAQAVVNANQAILKLSPAHQEFLFEARGDTFKAEVWGRIRWTRVNLKSVEKPELRQLVQEAYEQVAKPRTSSKRPTKIR